MYIYIHTRLSFILRHKYESMCVGLKRSRSNRKQSTIVANSIQCWKKKLGNLYSGTDQKLCDCDNCWQFSMMLFLLIFEIFISLVRSALLIANLFLDHILSFLFLSRHMKSLNYLRLRDHLIHMSWCVHCLVLLHYTEKLCFIGISAIAWRSIYKFNFHFVRCD